MLRCGRIGQGTQVRFFVSISSCLSCLTPSIACIPIVVKLFRIGIIWSGRDCIREMRKNASKQGDLTSGQRVKLLTDLLFEGNARKFARAYDCPQPTVSKVVNDQQPPPNRLLIAVAQDPRINIRWLLTGSGEPLVSLPTPLSEDGWLLPVAKSLMVGEPADNWELLDGAFPVAKPFFSPTRYWYVTNKTDVEQSPIEAGTWLLVDTNKQAIRKPSAHTPHVIVDPKHNNGKPVLAFSPSTTSVVDTQTVHRRRIELADSPIKEKSRTKKTVPTISDHKVVGVCILAQRDFV